MKIGLSKGQSLDFRSPSFLVRYYAGARIDRSFPARRLSQLPGSPSFRKKFPSRRYKGTNLCCEMAMKIEEVQSTTKKQRIATHTHIKGLGLEVSPAKKHVGLIIQYLGGLFPSAVRLHSLKIRSLSVFCPYFFF